MHEREEAPGDVPGPPLGWWMYLGGRDGPGPTSPEPLPP